MLSDQALIDIAGIISESGTCSRLQVGAVLTVDRRIISTGYNGAPSGMPHCEHPGNPEDWAEVPEAAGACETAVHAEANVIAFAAKNGVMTRGSVLYTTHSPCVTCARLLINAGAKEVIYEHEYRRPEGIRELEKAGIKVTGPYGPGMSTVQVERGDGESVHPCERTHPGFEDRPGTDEAADYR